MRPVATEIHDYKNGLKWGNEIASLRWNYRLTSNLFSNATITYSRYSFEIETKHKINHLQSNIFSEDLFKYGTGIKDLSAKIDFDFYLSTNHKVKFGTKFTQHFFTPGFSINYTLF